MHRQGGTNFLQIIVHTLMSVSIFIMANSAKGDCNCALPNVGAFWLYFNKNYFTNSDLTPL